MCCRTMDHSFFSLNLTRLAVPFFFFFFFFFWVGGLVGVVLLGWGVSCAGCRVGGLVAVCWPVCLGLAGGRVGSVRRGVGAGGGVFVVGVWRGRAFSAVGAWRPLACWCPRGGCASSRLFPVLMCLFPSRIRRGVSHLLIRPKLVRFLFICVLLTLIPQRIGDREVLLSGLFTRR